MSSDPNYNARIETTMGALWWGLQAATILWGVTTTQTWYYYETYKKDHLSLKILVGLVFLTDTAHEAVILHAMYHYLVQGWGNLESLRHVTATLYQDVTINGITGALVQAFFVYRIWIFSKGNIPMMILLSAMVITLLSEYSSSAPPAYFSFFTLGSDKSNIPRFEEMGGLLGLNLAINSLTAVVDVSLTVAVCYYLSRSRTGFAASETMLNKIIVLAINTGAITSVWTILILIAYLSLRGYYVYFGMYLVIGRLYANSLLATLNSRQRMRSTSDAAQVDAYNLDQFSQHPGTDTTGAVQVHMNIETVKDLEANQDDSESSNGPYFRSKGR
ncbi:hypothetical protein VNI00_003277 [Paramarasmius palmivorus]|uniref:DUF6534 domain-containing protein n=1 Tax=Paramarasmius palmivorus TaxID=297713 RepID=A0AAW0DSJ7_9AGAR